jgi:hypothetical protein
MQSLVTRGWWLVLTLALAGRAHAQLRPTVLAGVGLADHNAGTIGHVGVVALQTPRRPVGVRADAIAGRLGDARLGALSAAVEVAPRIASTGRAHDAPTRGVFLFAAAGPAVTWYGPARSVFAMLAVGTRVGLGRWIVTAEQRFQENFSPLLIGVAF